MCTLFQFHIPNSWHEMATGFASYFHSIKQSFPLWIGNNSKAMRRGVGELGSLKIFSKTSHFMLTFLLRMYLGKCSAVYLGFSKAFGKEAYTSSCPCIIINYLKHD